ncbi:MAG: CooT family nickel-binding protein [Desulfobulbaceae bacterium]|nr:CooT family nickel-binding protein [Desulfobulbaceae bacterium]
MCQTSVVLEKDGKQEKIMEAVARLEVTKEGISINALFEKPMVILGGQIKEIDFLDGVVTLVQAKG